MVMTEPELVEGDTVAADGAAWFTNTSPGMERAWHAVATSAEVGTDTPFGITLLGSTWALVRLSTGLVAFEDRCIHRLAPLRIGTVCGDRLQCAYHGWSYDVTGRCVDIPALGADAPVPAKARVPTAAAVVERYGLIWMAVADPVAPFPAFPEWGAPGFDCAMNEPRHTAVSVGHLVDNFLDATHLSTVHASTFGVTDDPVVPPFDVDRDGWIASSRCVIPYRNHDDPLVATGEHPLVQPQELFKQVLGPSTALVRLVFPLTGKTITFLFAACPETEHRTRLFKLMARDDYDGDAARMADALEFEDRVLDEDLVVLEAYDERRLALDLRTEVHTRADRLSVVYRRLLADLVASTVAAGGPTPKES